MPRTQPPFCGARINLISQIRSAGNSSTSPPAAAVTCHHLPLIPALIENGCPDYMWGMDGWMEGGCGNCSGCWLGRVMGSSVTLDCHSDDNSRFYCGLSAIRRDMIFALRSLKTLTMFIFAGQFKGKAKKCEIFSFPPHAKQRSSSTAHPLQREAPRHHQPAE